MAPETDYDPATTTNSGRFQANVYLRLARQARARGDDSVLVIHHEDWYQAFRQHTGLSDAEVPDFARLMREYEQDALIDPRPDAVIERVRSGREPEFAINVRLAFADPEASGDKFAYEDHYSDPAVRVENASVITFRLMDMGDELFWDEIRGSRAQPLTGSLGALFSVIGTAEIRSVRLALGEDGTAVSIAKARAAMVTVPTAVTTSPFGRSERGVPEGRSDLRIIEERLREPIEFDYHEPDWDALIPAARTAIGNPLPLEVEFIGNMALRINDGHDVLYTDFPYRSGASGYMTYPGDFVDDAERGVTIITHGHADHWQADLFAETNLSVVAPPALTAGIEGPRVLPWSDEIVYGGLVIEPLRTPHTDHHVSYRVHWGGRTLYFSGDTESTETLLAQTDLAVAFVSPWLLREVRATGRAIDADLVVIYHHTDGQELPRGPGIHVPSRNSTFVIQ
jgi:L-ascorbate metabolism protein UlaG (beta-lactamase superfamily)